MAAHGKVRVGVIGSQFQADIHVASIQQMGEEAEVVAIASPSPGNAERLARRYGVPQWFEDYREMLSEPSIEMVTIAVPNKLHCQLTLDIARAGKHVVCEKPLCMTMEEADLMIDVCEREGVLLLYAEELFFTPKYVRAKEIADQGGFGEIYLVKQSEKHFGPHAPWFWDIEQSGGGVLMDMGCHGIAFANWFLGRPVLTSVTAQIGTYVHADKTKGEDNAFVILEFEGNKVAMVEDSWARHGGMDDRIEVYGDQGLAYANLHMGNALTVYSDPGYGYAVEKATSTEGWTFPVFEELWNYGFPQEMHHFARCVRGKEEPIATGADGRLAQLAMFAAYQSAGAGRRVDIATFDPSGVAKPIDLWFSPLAS
jgi:myo-inositol 2-dehydrogenase/D-chiro-inositol 1-dehydrogenase